MNDYWHHISEKHKEKVRYLAVKNAIPVEQAFRNLMQQLEFEISEEPGSGKFEGMLTIRPVERMLDQISE